LNERGVKNLQKNIKAAYFHTTAKKKEMNKNIPNAKRYPQPKLPITQWEYNLFNLAATTSTHRSPPS
jgi:hypothetical protein